MTDSHDNDGANHTVDAEQEINEEDEILQKSGTEILNKLNQNFDWFN